MIRAQIDRGQRGLGQQRQIRCGALNRMFPLSALKKTRSLGRDNLESLNACAKPQGQTRTAQTMIIGVEIDRGQGARHLILPNGRSHKLRNI